MKLFFLTLSLATLLISVAAVGLGDLPGCARECATSAIPENCGIDVECICTAKSFIGDISCCVADKCSKDDQETTLKVAKSICARGGVTDIPDSVVCSTGASASSTAATTTAGDATSSSTSSSENSSVTGGAQTTTTGTKASSETGASKTASSSAAATTTFNAAIHGPLKDKSLMAVAGGIVGMALL